MKRMFCLIILSVLIMLPASVFASNCKQADRLAREAARQPERAMLKLAEAVSLCKSSANLKYNLAVALYGEGKKLQAKESLQQALFQNKRHGPAYNVLAVIEFDNNNLEKAMEYADKAVRYAPDNNHHHETRDEIAKTMAASITPAPKTGSENRDAILKGIHHTCGERRLWADYNKVYFVLACRSEHCWNISIFDF